MLIKDDEDEGSIFHVSMAKWEAAVSASSSVDAATQVLERLFEDLGGDLILSPTIRTINTSELFGDFELDSEQEYHYTPEILSNAGLHDLAKKMRIIIDINEDE